MLELLKMRQAKVRHLALHLHCRSVILKDYKGRMIFLTTYPPSHFRDSLKSLRLSMPKKWFILILERLTFMMSAISFFMWSCGCLQVVCASFLFLWPTWMPNSLLSFICTYFMIKLKQFLFIFFFWWFYVWIYCKLLHRGKDFGWLSGELACPVLQSLKIKVSLLYDLMYAV